MGNSTETVAFQVYEILKINHEFLQFFWLGSKMSVWDTIFSIWLSSLPLGRVWGNSNFQYPRLGNFLRRGLHNYGFSFIIASMAIDLPSPWSIWLLLSSYRHPIHRRNSSSSSHKNDWCSSFGKYQALRCLPRIKFLYDSILFSIIGINPSLN